jgi:hypothetical protein
MSAFTLGIIWYQSGNRFMPKYMSYGCGFDWNSFVDGFEFARKGA